LPLRKKGIRISRDKWLRSIPKRLIEDFEKDDKGNIVIIVELREKGLLSKILKIISTSPTPRYKRIVLDQMGSRVWMLCDGKHSIDDIVKILVRETGLSRRNIELAIYNFIKTLATKGLIELYIPVDEGGGSG